MLYSVEIKPRSPYPAATSLLEEARIREKHIRRVISGHFCTLHTSRDAQLHIDCHSSQ